MDYKRNKLWAQLRIAQTEDKIFLGSKRLTEGEEKVGQ
jgi:hypothetical protein